MRKRSNVSVGATRTSGKASSQEELRQTVKRVFLFAFAVGFVSAIGIIAFFLIIFPQLF